MGKHFPTKVKRKERKEEEVRRRKNKAGVSPPLPPPLGGWGGMTPRASWAGGVRGVGGVGCWAPPPGGGGWGGESPPSGVWGGAPASDFRGKTIENFNFFPKFSIEFFIENPLIFYLEFIKNT